MEVVEQVFMDTLRDGPNGISASRRARQREEARAGGDGLN